MAQAYTKILYGRELGIGPVASMMGIYIVEGKPAPSANLLAAMVKRSGKYNYRIKRSDAQAAEVEFFECGQSVGVSTFTMEEAQTAGLASKDNWRKYGRAMLFNRAVSAGVRMFAPDLFGGAPVYSPEELGAETGEDGAIIALPDSRVNTATGEVLPTRPDIEVLALNKTCGGLWRDLGNGTDRGEFLAALKAVSGEDHDAPTEFSIEALERFRDNLRAELLERVKAAGAANDDAPPAGDTMQRT